MLMSAVNVTGRITSRHNYKMHINVKWKGVQTITQLLSYYRAPYNTYQLGNTKKKYSEHNNWQLPLQPLMDGRSDCSGRKRLNGYIDG